VNLHVISDLHEEFGPFTIPPVDRDVLVLAGDVNCGCDALPFLKEACAHGPVIYVLGNHEFYHHDFYEIMGFWSVPFMKKLHVLENSVQIISNTRFVGATLWTSMNNHDPRAMKVASNEMSDYSVIDKSGRKLRPEDTIEFFDRSVKFLEKELQKDFHGRTVVVTHHLPSYKSVAPQFEGDPVNGSFASALDDFILEYQPALWIHGHTHVSCDYYIGDTRVVCNPRGYSDDDNPNFKPDLVLQI
jgi:Icc-related predicted phosphoesterase